MILHRFLLVSLSIETILGETTIRRRREKLKQMSKGQNVGDVYTATLERIRAQGEGRARLGMKAIMWIAYSERPLGPDELCQALGVEIGSTDLDNDNAPSIRTILNCGLGLVTVDSSSSKTRLVHFTLQEHIIANPTLFCSPHSMIAEVCLTYLNFGYIRDLSPTLRPLPPTTPFLEYASDYWGAHARRQTSTSVIPLALNLLDGFEAHISYELLIRQEDNGRAFAMDFSPAPSNFTALHAGAFIGVPEVMASLLKIDKWDLNATDRDGRTALMWATRIGHDAIVKVLLEQEGINPHVVDRLGRTPLLWAARDGYEGILEMLLERNDANPDTADSYGRTPLSMAAEREREKIVRMLLEQNDVNPDSADKNGRTPLSWATRSGLTGALRILLERNDVNPDGADKGGRTPLSWAAGPRVVGHSEGALRILLERNDVNPDSVDIGGRTPLSWAASDGSARVLQMLLERSDVNPDRADKSGRTPLSWAVGPGVWSQDIYNRRHMTVCILLERNDVDPDSTDKNGRTPLSWAAGSGHVAVLPMLLERNDVNPNSTDKSGQTPFSWASKSGHGGIAKLLLEQSEVNLDRSDKSGRTPLSWMAVNEREKTEGMLPVLQRNDAHPSTADKSGQTPFPWAAGNGGGRVVWEKSESHDLPSKSGLGERLSGPSTTDPSTLPEPPFKKIRRL